jgi:hypothetical protein
VTNSRVFALASMSTHSMLDAACRLATPSHVCAVPRWGQNSRQRVCTSLRSRKKAKPSVRVRLRHPWGSANVTDRRERRGPQAASCRGLRPVRSAVVGSGPRYRNRRHVCPLAYDAAMESRTPRSMRQMNPALGLHRLKREFQKKFMEEQCEQLVTVLDEAIAVTLREAPVRRRRYLVDRTGMNRSPAGEEARLEWALFQQWSSTSCAAVSECWTRIVNFQVNMPSNRNDSEWGEIDLLGIAEDGLPVLIELKRGTSQEPPPSVLVQAAAYGLALQKAWWFFRTEWITAIAQHGIALPMPTALLPCRLVCAAPQEYWDRWLPQSEMPTALGRLTAAFAVRGLRSAFVSLTATKEGYIARQVVSGDVKL